MIVPTKLHPPNIPSGFVSRPRLTSRLDHGREGKLTVVSAPAGFGKSLLIADWAAVGGWRADQLAWVSLDRLDNDPVRFWSHVTEALARTGLPMGEEVTVWIDELAADSFEPFLASLITELETARPRLVITLDDFHEVTSQHVLDQFRYFMEFLPTGVHVVATSRRDVDLPLPRLRASDDVTEVRAADLALTVDEIGMVLDGRGIDLSGDHLRTLAERTEGWPAAVKLAAIALSDTRDSAAFVNALAGDDRVISDYLLTEVLDRQPSPVRTFLVETATLDRFTAELCDKLLDRSDSRQLLDVIERRDLLLIPLDDERGWYRYHHLLADVLGAELQADDPGRFRALHGRAAELFEELGDVSETVEHAIAGEDWDRVMRHTLDVWNETAMTGGFETARRWLVSIPEEYGHRDPITAVLVGMVHAHAGERDESSRWLRVAEQLAEGGPDPMGVGAIARAHRAFNVLSVGDLDSARALAGDVTGATETDREGSADRARALALCILGQVELLEGRPEQALVEANRAVATAQEPTGGVISLDYGRLIGVWANWLLGHLDECDAELALFHDELDLDQLTARTKALRAYLAGTIALDRNNSSSAIAQLENAITLARHPGSWIRLAAPIALVGASIAAGDAVAAAQYWHAAKSAHDALKGTVPTAQVELAEAGAAAVAAGAVELDLEELAATLEELKAKAPLYLQARAAAALIRLRLASGDVVDGGSLEQAQPGRSPRTTIEASLALAALRSRVGDLEAAVEHLQSGLVEVERSGLTRLVFNWGDLLTESLTALEPDSAIAQHLLAEIRTPAVRRSSRSTVRALESGELIEALSDREIAVLQLLPSGKQYAEIGEELFISLNTVKTHVKAVYRKLAVTNRAAAIERARQQELL